MPFLRGRILSNHRRSQTSWWQCTWHKLSSLDVMNNQMLAENHQTHEEHRIWNPSSEKTHTNQTLSVVDAAQCQGQHIDNIIHPLSKRLDTGNTIKNVAQRWHIKEPTGAARRSNLVTVKPRHGLNSLSYPDIVAILGVHKPKLRLPILSASSPNTDTRQSREPSSKEPEESSSLAQTDFSRP